MRGKGGIWAPVLALVSRVRAIFGERGTRRGRVTRNAAWNWSATAANAILFFFLSPFIVNTLGFQAYGVWVVIQTVNGYLNFANFGIHPAILRHVARCDAAGDIDGLTRHISSAFVLFCVGSACILVACACITPFVPGWFGIAADLRAESITALWITAGGLALFFPFAAYTAILMGKQRYDINARVELITTVVRTVGVVVALTLAPGLVSLALANVVALALSMGLRVWKSRQLAPQVRVRPRYATKRSMSGLLQFGSLNIIYILAMQLSYQTDALVIGAALNLTAVTYFAVGSKLIFRMRNMMEGIGDVLAPAVGALDAHDDRETISRLAIKSCRAMLLLAMPACVYLLAFGGGFLERWMGAPEFRTESGPVLIALTLGALAPIQAIPLLNIHHGMNRMRSLASFALLEGVLNLALSLVLVHSHGVLGVAIGTAAPAFLVRGVLMPWWNCRELGISFARFLPRVWGPPLLAGGITYGIVRIVFAPHANPTWVELATSGVCTVLIFGVIAVGLQAAARGRSRGSFPTPS